MEPEEFGRHQLSEMQMKGCRKLGLICGGPAGLCTQVLPRLHAGTAEGAGPACVHAGTFTIMLTMAHPVGCSNVPGGGAAWPGPP